MKIAFFTPLNPMKSGISDFSEELLPELAKYMKIDLFIDDYKPTNRSIIDNFKIYNIKEFYKDDIRKQYDEYIYHIGNNEKYHEKIVECAIKYPGIVELHDISLHHMLAATTLAKGNKNKYIEEMEYCHGRIGRDTAIKFINGEIPPPWETDSLKFTVNKRIIDSSKAIIVHSDFAEQMIKGICNKPIITILLHTADIEENYIEMQRNARDKLGIRQDELLISSFGFVTRSKRVEQILYSLKKVKDSGVNFKYLIVGEVPKGSGLKNRICDLGLKNNVEVKGYVDLDLFKEYMKAIDICMNLRYPIQGETSASLHRALGMGKVVFVSDIGPFKDYPDDVVIKIPIDHDEIDCIYKNIIKVFSHKDFCKKIRRNAIQFSKKFCSLESNSLRYYNFIRCINREQYFEENISNIFADKLFELSINDFKVIRALCEKFSNIV